MCLSKAYIDRSGKKELLMQDIASVEVSEGKPLLKTLFGEREEIRANIRQIDFLSHSIILGNPDKP